MARSWKGQPDGALPLYRLPEQVEAAVRRRMASEPAEKVERAVRDAVRDAAALWDLFFVVNQCFMAESRTMWLLLLCLSHAITAWTRGELSRHGPPIEEQVRLNLRDLIVWNEVVETIGQRRYQGYDVLLPAPRKELDDLREKAEHQLMRFNDRLDFLVWKKQESGKRTPKLPKPIEWEDLGAEVAADVAAHVSLLVDLARAEACEMMGGHQRARWRWRSGMCYRTRPYFIERQKIGVGIAIRYPYRR